METNVNPRIHMHSQDHDSMNDYDRLRDDHGEPAPRKRSQRCQCGDELPGYCPGPANCPYSDRHDGDDD